MCFTHYEPEPEPTRSQDQTPAIVLAWGVIVISILIFIATFG
jgi:hypothetical protein